ncbi:hypothetical protein FPOAC2_10293 [Fusarium poae]|jgi:hypothetical protein|uniref:Uncharacterized protein n=1 Tax=Fusarium poae TaxID=36050 RepID=A0A1B8A857_FUSPO|nr:uncharacterized protein FPOAC1_013373 [Fusarium poae]KAG8664593.1 hypothetical protein FPOAC1_013373 [Fusarium poae]OBS16657.1 hypothetical protein FPOA_12696 [Fusarium poae]
MRGEELRRTVERFSSYDLHPPEELEQQRADRKKPCRPIEGLDMYEVYICTYIEAGCDYCTQRVRKMHDHMPVHGRKASEHTGAVPLWRTCKLQTYFTAKGLIDCFVVEDPSPSMTGGVPSGTGLATAPTSQEEGKLFEDLKADIIQASRDLDEEAGIVQDVEESRAEDRVPWLAHTGFPTHLRGLRDAEIMSSYALPRSGGPGGDDGEEEYGAGGADTDLGRILAAAESTFRDAYKLCSDKSPDRKMTQQRAKRLSNFRRDDSNMSSAKASKFRSFKNESSFTSYFRITKQLFAYYYRVVYRDDGHFTREDDHHVLPRDIIETTPNQACRLQTRRISSFAPIKNFLDRYLDC